MLKFHVHDNQKHKERTPQDFYIEIQEGVFAGTEFSMGNIRFTGEDEEGYQHISFDYDLLSPLKEDTNQGDLEEAIATVVHQILEDMVEAEESKDVIIDEDIEA